MTCRDRQAALPPTLHVIIHRWMVLIINITHGTLFGAARQQFAQPCSSKTPYILVDGSVTGHR